MEKNILDRVLEDASSVWVFGYGSLIWRPNFTFSNKCVGFITGYERKFWQGNATHRGTPEKPGRVATLIEKTGGKVWGVAYEVCGRNEIIKALGYLNNREATLGGYTYILTKFYSRDDSNVTYDVLVYVATPSNKWYLGPDTTESMAEQIVETSGDAGFNSQYVTQLADYVRKNIPEDEDEDLFALDSHIRRLILDCSAKTLDKIQDLMGEYPVKYARDAATIRREKRRFQKEFFQRRRLLS